MPANGFGSHGERATTAPRCGMEKLNGFFLGGTELMRDAKRPDHLF